MNDLARCIKEEVECADYIRSGGPDQCGARQGASDWVMEQALIGSNEDYCAFLDRKMQSGSMGGFEPLWMPDFLFDFQRAAQQKQRS